MRYALQAAATKQEEEAARAQQALEAERETFLQKIAALEAMLQGKHLDSLTAAAPASAANTADVTGTAAQDLQTPLGNETLAPNGGPTAATVSATKESLTATAPSLSSQEGATTTTAAFTTPRLNQPQESGQGLGVSNPGTPAPGVSFDPLHIPDYTPGHTPVATPKALPGGLRSAGTFKTATTPVPTPTSNGGGSGALGRVGGTADKDEKGFRKSTFGFRSIIAGLRRSDFQTLLLTSPIQQRVDEKIRMKNPLSALRGSSVSDDTGLASGPGPGFGFGRAGSGSGSGSGSGTGPSPRLQALTPRQQAMAALESHLSEKAALIEALSDSRVTEANRLPPLSATSPRSSVASASGPGTGLDPLGPGGGAHEGDGGGLLRASYPSNSNKGSDGNLVDPPSSRPATATPASDMSDPTRAANQTHDHELHQADGGPGSSGRCFCCVSTLDAVDGDFITSHEYHWGVSRREGKRNEVHFNE